MVIIGMVRYFMPVLEHSLSDLHLCAQVSSYQKKSRRDIFPVKDRENPGGYDRVRAIVEGQRDQRPIGIDLP